MFSPVWLTGIGMGPLSQNVPPQASALRGAQTPTSARAATMSPTFEESRISNLREFLFRMNENAIRVYSNIGASRDFSAILILLCH
jgi:hypothetical protein